MSEPPAHPTPDDLNVVHNVQGSIVIGPGDHGRQPQRKRARQSHERVPAPSETPTVAKSKGKRRRTAGMLSELMNMPLDVFFEVAAHLHPLDMLHLSRTSKSLRSLLFARSSRSAWIASFATVLGLPSCPENMNEPFYAALLFDRHCFLCGSAHGKWVDYAIRLRLCKPCYDASIRKASEFLREAEMGMLCLFPCETGPDYKSAQKVVLATERMGRNKYYAAKVTTALNEVLALFAQKDRQDSLPVIKQMLTDVANAHMHAFDVLVWYKERSLLKQLANQDIAEDRKSKTMKRLQELGYTKNDFHNKEAWDKLVDQLKLLADRIWNNIRPKLEELLAVQKERRAQQAIAKHVDHRLEVLVEWFEDYIKEHLTDAERGLMPNRHDARELPSLVALALADDAHGDVSREAFLATTEQMLADAEAYKTRAKRELADILCNHSAVKYDKLHDRPADDVLRGPLAYFRCKWRCSTVTAVDGSRFLTYEQLHAHWREAHPNDPWLRQGDEYYRSIGVEIPTLGSDSVLSVAQCALFGPQINFDTPREVLDGWVREGRLFCPCGHPSLPPPGEMNWAKLFFHLLCQFHQDGERVGEILQPCTSRKQLHGKYDVLRYPHLIVPCIKFLPAGADTAVASVRTTVDDACRMRIEERLATRPNPNAFAVCRICKDLSRKTPVQVRKRKRLLYCRLPAQPEEIVWHLWSCHEKEFEESDILFVTQ